jgi:phage shock protein A
LRKKSHAISEALTDARELVEKLESEHETLIAQMSELEAYRAMVLPDYLPD